MSTPYSSRVMSGRGGNRKESFTVPEGRRLVILHVSVMNWADGSSSARLDLHGIQLWFLTFTTAGDSIRSSVRFTLYERETVEFFLYGPDLAYAVDGYLLRDADGTPDDAHNVITPLAAERPSPLPASS